MELASAYPNSAISTGAMILIAVVMAGSLGFWLVMVFVADRQRRNLSARLAAKTIPDLGQPDKARPVLARPEETAEDEPKEAGHGDGGRRTQQAA